MLIHHPDPPWLKKGPSMNPSMIPDNPGMTTSLPQPPCEQACPPDPFIFNQLDTEDQEQLKWLISQASKEFPSEIVAERMVMYWEGYAASKRSRKGNPTDYYPEQTAMLQRIANAAVKLLQSKDQTYRGSWKRRGGRGAWFTMVRPLDRLEELVKQADEDIFKALLDDDAAGKTGRDGSVMATLNDVIGYCMLVKAWFLLQKNPYPRPVIDKLRESYEGRVKEVSPKTRVDPIWPKGRPAQQITVQPIAVQEPEYLMYCHNCKSPVKVTGQALLHLKCPTCSGALAEHSSTPKLVLDGPPFAIGYCGFKHAVGLTEEQYAEFAKGTLNCTVKGCHGKILRANKDYR